MSARISADQLHTLHMKAVDAAKELTCEIEFALEVVRDGSIVDGNLSRRISEWNQALTELAISVHGEARIPGGGLDWAPEAIELRRVEEAQREAKFAEYRTAQAELVAKQQEVAELEVALGLDTSTTKVSGSRVTVPSTALPNRIPPDSLAVNSTALTAKPPITAAVVAPTAGAKGGRRECDVCRSRNGLRDFAGTARCKQCYADEMTVRRVRDTLASFGVKPLGERSGGESAALARMRKEGEDAKYALLARRQSSMSQPAARRTTKAPASKQVRTQGNPKAGNFKAGKERLQDRWNNT